MSPQDAIILNNLIPDTNGVEIRPGYVQHVQLVSSNYATHTLMAWKTQYGDRLIAGAPTSGSSHSLFDASTSSVVTIKTGYVGGRWRSGVMSGRMALVNGSDQPQELTYTPGGGTVVRDLAISGGTPNPEALKLIHIFKSRSYFATGTEPAFWYSAVNALGGSLTRFAIDRVASTSGNVIDINSWTRDGGDGPDDFFVLFLDTGEVIAYAGSNPGDASDWALVGRYKLGRVLTSTQFGGKLHVVTDQDYNILPDDLLTEGVGTPSKLSGAARDAVARDQTDNWQVFFDAELGWRIVNVPYSSSREQHVTNLRTGGSCRLTYPAHCWAKYNGELYFGGVNAKIFRIRDGDDAGTAIEWACQQAFTDFKDQRNKVVSNYRPLWSVDGSFTLGSGLAFDYDVASFFQEGDSDTDGPFWNISPWNTTSWSDTRATSQDWFTGGGMGQNVSLIQSGTATKVSTWHHTDYRLELAADLL
jgi:hypothetical protein